MYIVLGDVCASSQFQFKPDDKLYRSELWNPPLFMFLSCLYFIFCAKPCSFYLKYQFFPLKKTILATFNKSRLGSARLLRVKVRFVLNGN